jgi:hypothetical protein
MKLVDNPMSALEYIPFSSDVKEGFKTGVAFYNDPTKLSEALKLYVPDKYKEYYDSVEAGVKRAADLKSMADEAKLQMIEVVLEPLILNREGLTKSECESPVKASLDKIGMSQMWNQNGFDHLFTLFDPENTGILTKRKLAELVNLLAFGRL